MAKYTVYFLWSDGNYSAREPLLAANDKAAFEIAADRAKGRPFELWRDGHLLASVMPKYAA